MSWRIDSTEPVLPADLVKHLQKRGDALGVLPAESEAAIRAAGALAKTLDGPVLASLSGSEGRITVSVDEQAPEVLG